MSIFKGLAPKRANAEKSPQQRAADGSETADNAARSSNLVPLRDRLDSGASGDSPAPDAGSRNMWDLVGETADTAPVEDDTPVPSIAPALAEAAPRRSGRIKTRLLGIDHSNGTLEQIGAADAAQVRFPVGWLVVVSGPGRGHAYALRPGVSQIGRSEGQAVCLDFGDTAISREGHALIAYDEESRKFFVGHGGKANLVRLNGKPLLSTESISHGDVIRLGETTLMLATLCGEGFSWNEEGGEA